MDGAIERIITLDREPGRPHQRDRAAQEPDQGRRVALPLRADEATADGLPGRGRGLAMATRRRTASPRRATGRSTGTTRKRPTTASRSSSGPQISPDVARSLVGIAILVVGVITLVALTLPGEGRLTDWWRNAVAPWLGTGRWLLPPLLIVAGIYVQQAKGVGARWGVALIGAAFAYICLLGLIELTNVFGFTGGRIGRAHRDVLRGDRDEGGSHPAPGRVHPAPRRADRAGSSSRSTGRCRPSWPSCGRGAKAVGDSLVAPADIDRGPGWRDPRVGDRPPERRPGRRSAGQGDRAGGRRMTPRPSNRAPSPVPMSQTIWSGQDGPPRDGGSGLGRRPAPVRAPGWAARSSRSGSASASGSRSGSEPAAWPARRAPGRDRRRRADRRRARDQLGAPVGVAPRGSGRGRPTAARWTTRRTRPTSRRSCAASGSRPRSSRSTAARSSPSTRSGRTPGSRSRRIEGLADDLAMALMARSIRIEAPIPGKDTVGIEIPNVKSETVDFRTLVDDTQMLSATSRLTFALGRDVSGKAYAVDLAKMPHLLIAGRDRVGQERLRQRPDHEPPDARPTGRGPADPGRPQAGRARAVRRAAAPPPARDRRAARGEGRPQLGRPRDGGALQAARLEQRPEHRRLQREGRVPTSACRTSS